MMKLRVLIAVADGNERWELREHLREQGFDVFATGTAPAAIHWLEHHAVDAVVADCLLPGTGMAMPHLMKRRAISRTARSVGIVRPPLTASERLRDLLGYDELWDAGVPVVRLTKRLHQLCAVQPSESQPLSSA